MYSTEWLFYPPFPGRIGIWNASHHIIFPAALIAPKTPTDVISRSYKANFTKLAICFNNNSMVDLKENHIFNFHKSA